MRRYLIWYWVEQNDESTDLEIIIEANNIKEAIDKFEKQVRLFKRISTITELPYNEQSYMRVTNQILWDIYQSYDCSRTEFSIILGYGRSNSNVSLWLNGTKDLSLDQLEKFCNKLGKKLTIKIEKL